MATHHEDQTRPANRSMAVGANILAFFFLVNALPGIGSVAFIAVGNHAPALRYVMNATEIGASDRRIVAAADGIALLLNTLIVGYCGLAFFVVRRCLLREQKWSLVVLALGVVMIQVAGYASDLLFFGGKNLPLLHISSLVFLLGMGLCARGLARSGTTYGVDPLPRTGVIRQPRRS